MNPSKICGWSGVMTACPSQAASGWVSKLIVIGVALAVLAQHVMSPIDPG